MIDDDLAHANRWFGESWGAPACHPDLHVGTPVGRKCLFCEKPIEPNDRGFMMPYGAVTGLAIEPVHHSCLMKSLLPHGRDCVHCRGLNPSEHAEGCAYRESRKNDCDCYDESPSQ